MLDSTSSSPPPDFSPAADSSAPVSVPTRHRKVAILGFGRTAKDCPWQDPSWELWAMNGFWRAAEADHGVKAAEDRYTLWFDMHTIEYTREYGKAAGIDGKQEAWLKQPHPFPIFMLDEDPELPSVVRFPIDELIAAVGRDYFTSTVAYALAFTLTQPDIAEVGLWGIDLCHNTEYTDQRPCAEYWIAKVEAAGIKVVIHDESALLKHLGRYGYESPNPLAKDMRAHLVKVIEASTKLYEKNQAQLLQNQAQLHTDGGGIQALQSILERLDIWTRGGKI